MYLVNTISMHLVAFPGMVIVPDTLIRRTVKNCTEMEITDLTVNELPSGAYDVSFKVDDCSLDELIDVAADLSLWDSIATIVLQSGDVCIIHTEDDIQAIKTDYKGTNKYFIQIH